MGNQQSFTQHHDFKDLQTNYTYEKKYNDTRFGEVKLLKENNSGQKIFQKDFTTNTSKEFEDYLNQVRDGTILSHPNVLKIYGYNSKKEDLFCADFYKLSLFFESFENDLEQEIARRNRSKEYFSEEELWYILDSVASATAYLQKNKIPHTDIRPFNIFITESKDYKLSASHLFKQSYNPAYFGNFEGLEARSRYYSPEVLAFVNNKDPNRKPIDEYKSDVYSLGMTMLECGNLEKVADAYDFKALTVNQKNVQGGLNKLRERYSENFVKTIESTLDSDPENRLDFIRLDNELGLYRKDIREKARGEGSQSTYYERTVQGGITRTPGQDRVEQAVRAASPTYKIQDSDDLDIRVREAIRRSEEVIHRSSPTKYQNKNLDPYIQQYLNNSLRKSEQPLLYTISPYLTSESKYTTTLTIEQPNYGRESQPINFNQPQTQENPAESFKRSGYVDVNASSAQQPGGYAQNDYSTGNYGTYGATSGVHQTYTPTNAGANYGAAAAAQSYTPSNAGANYGSTSGVHQTYTPTNAGANATYGLSASGQYNAGTTGTGAYGAGTYGTTGAYATAGTGAYGTSNSGVYGTSGAGNYGTTGTGAYTSSYSYGGGNYGTTGTAGAETGAKDYSVEADELSRRITERLNQSRTLNQPTTTTTTY